MKKKVSLISLLLIFLVACSTTVEQVVTDLLPTAEAIVDSVAETQPSAVEDDAIEDIAEVAHAEAKSCKVLATAGLQPVTPTAELRFEQIDDAVDVFLNGQNIVHRTILHRNDPQVVVDLTDKLSHGSNDLRLTASNGPGAASLIAYLVVNNQVVHSWNKQVDGMQNTVFLDETVQFAYPTDKIQLVNCLRLTFVQVDDDVQVTLNDEKVFENGIIHHGQPQVTVDLTDKLVDGENRLAITAVNGPATATLMGYITADDVVVYSWNEHPGSVPSGPFLEQTILVEKVHWGYHEESAHGPSQWSEQSPAYEFCAIGQQQSPINITNAKSGSLPAINFSYTDTEVEIENNGHTIEFVYDEGSHITVDGVTYNLKQFHFHTPSEHAVDNVLADGELHLVHFTADGSRAAVVGLRIVKGAEANAVLAPFWEHLPAEALTSFSDEHLKLNAAELLPEDHSYYTYSGSLTTPPCGEGVKWMVLRTTIEMSEAQINQLEAIMGHNNRPLQPLEQRDLLVGDGS